MLVEANLHTSNLASFLLSPRLTSPYPIGPSHPRITVASYHQSKHPPRALSSSSAMHSRSSMAQTSDDPTIPPLYHDRHHGSATVTRIDIADGPSVRGREPARVLMRRGARTDDENSTSVRGCEYIETSELDAEADDEGDCAELHAISPSTRLQLVRRCSGVQGHLPDAGRPPRQRLLLKRVHDSPPLASHSATFRDIRLPPYWACR